MREISSKITLDLDYLKELGITPTQYSLAYCIEHKDKFSFNEIKDLYKIDCFKEDIHHLILKGYLKGGNPKNIYHIDFDKSTIIGIFTKETKEEKESEEDLTWTEFVDAFRDLFPAGIKSGGFYVKSSKRDLDNKLKKFVKEYKYTQETILEATKCYVEESAIKGYAYMKVANYFIYKNNESMLASACEAVKDGGVDSGGISSMFNNDI
jgi:hypothetical protein